MLILSWVCVEQRKRKHLLCHDFGTFIVTRAFLSRSINCTLHMEEERFRRTVVWFTQNNEKFCKSCKGHTVKAQFVAFFKEITFRLRYALGMRQLLRSIPFLFVRHTQCITGNGDYMLVWHDASVCVLPVCTCDHLPRCDSG